MNEMKMLKGAALFIAGSCLLLTSCEKDNSDELKAREKENLQSYITSHNITTEPNASGLYYIINQPGTGARPTLDGAVKFDYTMRLITDDVIVSTIKDTALLYDLDTLNVNFSPIKYRPQWLISGLKEGLLLMHEGEVATFIIPSELAYKGTGNSYMGIDPYTTIIYQISLHGVAPDALAWEHQAIASYLDTVPPEKVADSTTTGVIHIIDTPGTGSTIANNAYVSIRFRGYFIEGHKFAEIPSSQAAATLQVGASNNIAGINEGVKLMKLGEVGRLIVPYKQGFNENLLVSGIPPFSTLVYEITSLEE
jgi:FKBP-type peptidyl-prolyl cis-trans isomerase FkpA